MIKIIDNADSWNEEDLKLNFISILNVLADFNDSIKGYYDREFSATVDNVYLNCKADMMLSKGIGGLIETSYFFYMNTNVKKNTQATHRTNAR